MTSCLDIRPPCWPAGTQPNACASALHERVVHNHVWLHGPWAGWRLAGRDLVSPDGQRIDPHRLRGLLWRDEMELRRAGYASRRRAETNRCSRQRVKVVIVELAELRCRGVAAG